MLRRVIAYGLVVLIVLVPLLLVVLWQLFKAKPEGYTRASDFSRQELENRAAEFITAGSKLANALADKSGGTPVDVTFTDAMINAQIRILPQEQLRKLPQWLTNPQVVFTNEAIILMGDIDCKDTRSVVSMHLAPSVTEDGQLKLRVLQLRAGRLPMPDAVRGAMSDLAARQLEEARRRASTAQESGHQDKHQEEMRKIELAALEVALGLLKDGQATVEAGRFHLKLEALELLPHQFRLVGRRVDQPRPASQSPEASNR